MHLRGFRDPLPEGRRPQHRQQGIDSLELFVIPVLLGDVRMFPPSSFSRPLRLDGATALGKGMVRLAYGLTP